MPLTRPILLLSLGCAVAAGPAAAELPLVPSGAFDTPFALLNWLTPDDPDMDFDWTDEDVDEAPDSGSLRIATNDMAIAALAFSSCAPAQPGAVFAFSAWHLAPGPIPGRASLHLYWAEGCSSAPGVGISEVQLSTAEGEWTQLAGVATAPPGTGSVRVAVGAQKLQNAPAPYLVYFDRVALPEPASAPAIAIAGLALLARRRHTRLRPRARARAPRAPR